MRYKITIEETTVEETVLPKEWRKVGEKEVRRNELFISENEQKTRIEPAYDYTPETTTRKSVTRKILEQDVPTLDLAAVIRAINNL